MKQTKAHRGINFDLVQQADGTWEYNIPALNIAGRAEGELIAFEMATREIDAIVESRN